MSSTRRFPADAAEDPVHETGGILGRVALREHHGLVDRDLCRHLSLLELVHPDPQDVALERTQAVGRPVVGGVRDPLVERGRLSRDGAGERGRELVRRALEEALEREPGEVPLVEEEQRLTARLPAAHRRRPAGHARCSDGRSRSISSR
jgi:hypothetical protein